MMPEKNPNGKLTLEDLLHLKRSEQPSADFWSDFQRELHERQRAAAIEPRRWWFVLPRVFKGLARYQMPVGAAAVLAVTFLSFRDYREPSFDVVYTTPVVPAAPAATPVAPTRTVAVEATTIDLATMVVEAAPSDLASNLPMPSAHRIAEELATAVAWAAAPQSALALNLTDSPSARSIATNLAAVEAEQSQVRRMLGEPELRLATTNMEVDPLAQLNSLEDARRQRLFEYDPTAAPFATNENGAEETRVHTKIASRLSDDVLYDSVRRLSAVGDRLTLKF